MNLRFIIYFFLIVNANTLIAQDFSSTSGLELRFDDYLMENAFDFFTSNAYYISDNEKDIFIKVKKDDYNGSKFYKYNLQSNHVVGISKTIDSSHFETKYQQILSKALNFVLNQDKDSYWYHQVTDDKITSEISIDDCRRIIRNITPDSILSDYPKLKDKINSWIQWSELDKNNYSVYKFNSITRDVYIIDDESNNTGNSLIILDKNYDIIENPNPIIFNRINIYQYFRNLKCSNNKILAINNVDSLYTLRQNPEKLKLLISIFNLDTEEMEIIYDGNAFERVASYKIDSCKSEIENLGFSLKSDTKINKDNFSDYFSTKKIPHNILWDTTFEIILDEELSKIDLNCEHYANTDWDVYYFLTQFKYPRLIISHKKDSNFWKVLDTYGNISRKYIRTDDGFGFHVSSSKVLRANNLFERELTSYNTSVVFNFPFNIKGEELIKYLMPKNDFEELKLSYANKQIDSLNLIVNFLPGLDVIPETYNLNADYIRYALSPFPTTNIGFVYNDVYEIENDSLVYKSEASIKPDEDIKSVYTNTSGKAKSINLPTVLLYLGMDFLYEKFKDKEFMRLVAIESSYDNINNTLSLVLFPPVNESTKYFKYFERLLSFLGTSKDEKYVAYIDYDREEELLYKLKFNFLEVSESYKRNNLVKIYNLESRQVVYQYFPQDINSVTNFAVLNNDILIAPINSAHNKIIDVSDEANPFKLADYYFFNPEEWYVIASDGFYDKSDFAKDNLYYVYNNSEVFDLDDFQKNYRVEGLLDMLKAGKSPRDEFPNVLSLKEQIKNLPPIIEYELKDNLLQGSITMRKGGAYNIFLNIAGRDIMAINPNFKNDSTATISVDLSKYHDYIIPNTTNNVYVRATNENNSIKTKGPIINYEYKNPQYNPNAKFYALFVGINKYNKNPLEFAVNDADKMKDYIELINAEWVNNYNSSLDYKPEITFLPDSLAVKDNIEKALESISKKARAQDIVMLFFSGHGIAADAINPNKNKKDAKGNKNQNFYYITKDFDTFNYTSFSELDINDDLSSPQAISSDQLKAFLSNKDLKAQKKILVMDACYSGQFLEEVKGNPKSDLTREQQQALRDLNDKTGTVIITASRSKEKAYEADKYQHSFLTWGLIKALKEDYSRDDDLLNVSNWLLNTKNIVENQTGSNKSQRPSISLNKDVDFQLGIINTDIQNSIKLKEPLLIMNLTDIDEDQNDPDNTFDVANKIEKEFNLLLKRHHKQEDLNKRVFTLRETTDGSLGYQVTGFVVKQEKSFVLKLRVHFENKPIALDLPPCNEAIQNQYCFTLSMENYLEELPNIINDLAEIIKSLNDN